MATITPLSPSKTIYTPVPAASHTESVDVPVGRIAVGIAALVTDNGDQFTVQLGSDSQTLTLKSGSLENLASTIFEDGVIFDVASAGTKTLTITAGTGTPTISGVIVRAPDSTSNIVQDQTMAHCYPTATWYKNKLYQLHVEIYTGNIYLSINGMPWGKLFDGVTGRRNDNYHFGAFICSHPSGLVFGRVGHTDSRIDLRFALNGNMAALSVSNAIGGASSSLTYASAVCIASGDLLIMTRGDDTASGASAALLYRISNVSGTPTYTVDVVFDITTSDTPYPRECYKMTGADSTELVCFHWNSRATAATWRRVITAIFDPAGNSGVGKWTGQIVSIAGTSSLGTIASPRFTDTQCTNTVDAGTGLSVLAQLTGGQRYHDGALFDVSNWPTRADFVAPFWDVAGVTDSNNYGSTEHRWVLQLGQSTGRTLLEDKIITDTPDPNSYRLSAALCWQNGNPTSGNAYLLVTDRGTRAINNAWGEAIESYYDWGTANRVTVYLVEGVMTAGAIFTLIGTFIVTGGYTLNQIKNIENLPGHFICDYGVNELHETHRQILRRILTVEGPPIISGSIGDGGSGNAALRTRPI